MYFDGILFKTMCCYRQKSGISLSKPRAVIDKKVEIHSNRALLSTKNAQHIKIEL